MNDQHKYGVTVSVAENDGTGAGQTVVSVFATTDPAPEAAAYLARRLDEVIRPPRQTVVRQIAAAIEARRNCIASGNTDWFIHWTTELQRFEEDYLPSGSGIDAATSIDLDASTADKIVLRTSYHHMNEAGFYAGWTEHTVVVTPAFSGFHLRITGHDRNQIKDYLGQTFREALGRKVMA